MYVGRVADSANFCDSWANNCAANSATNGVDLRSEGTSEGPVQSLAAPQRVKAGLLDLSAKKDVALPGPYVPTLPTTGGSEAVIKSYVLPGNKTGVMFVGSFEPDDYYGFQTDAQNAINDILASGADQLIIDLTNNGGGVRLSILRICGAKLSLT